jgi:methanogenic corrinoid protein MtbC1
MSAVLAPFLVSLRDSAPSSTEAPRIVIGTPSGHLHEFGAQMAAIVAAAEGWQVIFLGTNLPVEEFALAAHRTGARVVALSMIYPKDTPRLAEGLQRLSAQIPEGGTLIVGGNAARAYLPMMLRHGLRRCDSLEDFRYLLRDLRSGPVN